MTRKATADAKESLAPNQLGVGVKGGAEAIIHAVNAVFHDNNIADKDKWILQVDFSNAFNGISREEMQNRIREHCPKAAAWTESCYSSASHLFFSQTKICSSTGSQQGDPEASLLFSLVLLPLIKRIKEECPNLLLLLFYLEDGTLLVDVLICKKPSTLSKTRDLVWVSRSILASLSSGAGPHPPWNSTGATPWTGMSHVHLWRVSPCLGHRLETFPSAVTSSMKGF